MIMAVLAGVIFGILFASTAPLLLKKKPKLLPGYKKTHTRVFVSELCASLLEDKDWEMYHRLDGLICVWKNKRTSVKFSLEACGHVDASKQYQYGALLCPYLIGFTEEEKKLLGKTINDRIDIFLFSNEK